MTFLVGLPLQRFRADEVPANAGLTSYTLLFQFDSDCSVRNPFAIIEAAQVFASDSLRHLPTLDSRLEVNIPAAPFVYRRYVDWR